MSTQPHHQRTNSSSAAAAAPQPSPPTSSSTVSMKQKLMALTALGTVSTAVGFFTKRSQVGGRYRFHPASAVVCTELFKLTISLVIIFKMIIRREVGGGDDDSGGGGRMDGDEGSGDVIDSGGSGCSMSVSEFASRAFRFFKQEFSVPMLIHTAGLAVSYSIVNLVTYAIFVHASGSMFFLLKASSPVVTAILLYVMVSRAISKPQWLAVVGQCIGLLATQVNPCAFGSGSSTGIAKAGTTVISVTGYMLILINIAISCTAGVWNDHVVKTYGASVNAQNVALYSWGILVNYSLFLWAPPHWMGMASEGQTPSFFEGYNIPVICVICANGSVGLVITAVYKYADVVVKTFGLAGSTVALFVMEFAGLIPGSGKGVPMASTVMGASVVFYAAYLYILPKDAFAVLVPGNSVPQVPTTWGNTLWTPRVARLLYLVSATLASAFLYFFVLCAPTPSLSPNPLISSSLA